MSRLIAVIFVSLLLAACGHQGNAPEAEHGHGHGKPAAADFERGPHRGRMLRDGDFALEITIYETHVPPQFRLYAYQGDKPLPADSVVPKIELKRLDGETNPFTFTAENDYLVGSGTVHEPHSFDVSVSAVHAGKTHTWTYASYEGRTTIPRAAAEDAGVKTETAGPATLKETVQLMGNIMLDANRHARIKARFPGVIREVPVQQGQQVRRGQTLVVIEGNDSMRRYPVVAPFDGVVLARSTNVGDVAGDNVLIELADLSSVWVELRALGSDAEKLADGQDVLVKSATGDGQLEASIQTLLPVAGNGQSVIARMAVSNTDGKWRPGMAVTGEVTVASLDVPLAVRESGLQRFRDFTVVFAQVGDTYEVRMLDLGQRDGQYAQVLGGLKPGTRYVTEQSYLIKADIEKSGASHDH